MVSSLLPNRSKDAHCHHGNCSAIVALPDVEQSEQARRTLRRLGWKVRAATTATDVRRQLQESPDSVVILGPQLADETGWLTCAKLTVRGGRARVVMIGANTARNRLMARLAGAAALVADPAAIGEWI